MMISTVSVNSLLLNKHVLLSIGSKNHVYVPTITHPRLYVTLIAYYLSCVSMHSSIPVLKQYFIGS